MVYDPIVCSSVIHPLLPRPHKPYDTEVEIHDVDVDSSPDVPTKRDMELARGGVKRGFEGEGIAKGKVSRRKLAAGESVAGPSE